MALWDNFLTKRYAPMSKVLPDPKSPRSKFPLVDSKQRAGADYEFPVVVSGSHGITYQNATNGSVTLNTPISPESLLAVVTVPNQFNSERIDNATIMRAMNGVNESGQAASYFDPIDFHVNACIDGLERRLDITYLHGAGTGAAVADDIGVAASATGTNLGTAGYKVRFTSATWSEGIWNQLKNCLVDIYASNGSTVVATDVICQGISDETVNEVAFFKSGSAATVAATNRFVFKGALGAEMYGVGALLRNTTTLWNIDAAAQNFWKARTFSCGSTALTSAKLLQACARLQSAGQEKGLVGFLHPLQFNDIVAERDALVKYNDQAKNVEIGTDTIQFATAAGPVELMRCTTQKQGQAFLISVDDVVSVGSCLPMLSGSDGNGPIVQRVAGTTAYEVQAMSTCAPLLRKPAQNLIITNITPGGQT